MTHKTRPAPHIQIKRQRRKSMVMRLTPAGDVVVLIPRWLKQDHPKVRKFINDGLQQIESYIPAEKPAQQHNAESIRALVDHWAARTGIEPGRVQMRTMYRKWGSCSSRGNITLNTALYWLPHHLVEYVIVHELVHLREFNHDAAFWALLETHIPDYRARERELDTYRV